MYSMQLDATSTKESLDSLGSGVAVLEASEIAVIRTTPFELTTRAIYLTGQWFTL